MTWQPNWEAGRQTKFKLVCLFYNICDASLTFLFFPLPLAFAATAATQRFVDVFGNLKHPACMLSTHPRNHTSSSTGPTRRNSTGKGRAVPDTDRTDTFSADNANEPRTHGTDTHLSRACPRRMRAATVWHTYRCSPSAAQTVHPRHFNGFSLLLLAYLRNRQAVK